MRATRSSAICEPVVTGFHYANAAEATIPEAIVNALRAPDLEGVIIAPCNPYHTVRPILETGGINRRGPRWKTWVGSRASMRNAGR